MDRDLYVVGFSPPEIGEDWSFLTWDRIRVHCVLDSEGNSLVVDRHTRQLVKEARVSEAA